MPFWRAPNQILWSKYLLAAIFVGQFPALTVADGISETDDDDIEVAEPADNPQLRGQPSTHKQTTAISAAGESGSQLKAFSVARDGKVLALVQVGLPNAPNAVDEEGPSLLAQLFGAKKKTIAEPKVSEVQVPGAKVRVFDSQGKRLAEWPVDFMAEAMCLAPDDCLYLAGSGRIARFDLQGRLLAAADTPQTALIEQDHDALREAAEAQIKEQQEANENAIKQFKDQRDELTKKGKTKLTDEERQELASLDEFIEQFKQMQGPEQTDVDAVIADIISRLKRINALAVNKNEVFLTCGQTKGYGYGVWRMKLDFSEPKCIITGLSGCCGQMDVCCHGDELWVAENSRHRVVRYNRDGKRLTAFGKRDRDGIGAGFGGCCNPMNLCFGTDGDLLVAESDGQVKHFTTAGKFVGLVGVAHVKPGCKNSAISISANGDQLYYIDVEKSQILVLARDDSRSKAAE